MAHILWFDQHDPANEPMLGGKNASLGILTSAGLPVPPGFAVSADAYRRAFADSGLDDQIAALMADLDPSDSAQVGHRRTNRARAHLHAGTSGRVA